MDKNISIEALGDWSQNLEPVFIVGPERSGTSMMFRTVVSHPSFCSFDSATVETFSFIKPRLLLNEAGPENYEMRLYLGSEYNSFKEFSKAFIERNKKCDDASLDSDYLGHEKPMRDKVWNERGYRDLLRGFLYYSSINLGGKRLAEKTPAHVRCIDELMDCFPKAKVLVCLREPSEIVASHRKRLAKEIELGKSEADESLGWLKKSVDEYISYFRFIERKTASAKKKYPKNVISVSYSQVTTSESYLVSVFNFIGESYQETESRVDSKLAPDWDPLLSAAPQKNQIPVEDWLSELEISDLDKAGKELNWS